MSVFRDFQSAWALRFPNCDLPRAWEEDVRSNLDRHRSRVAVLKEELEKEEFYVEYLERLLADVERGRSNSSSSSNIVSSSPSTTNGLIPKASPRTSTGNNNNNNSLNHQQSTMTPAATTTSNATSNRDARNGSIDSSHGSVGDQYVTVISVSSGEERGKDSSDSSNAHLKRQSSSHRGSRVSYY